MFSVMQVKKKKEQNACDKQEVGKKASKTRNCGVSFFGYTCWGVCISVRALSLPFISCLPYIESNHPSSRETT